ncbi:hypothetical protein OH76DRAFT_247974 [Lentinus brumalis]|uniref:Uncharacterized protein n=1 Tax=Lentinus brumalis TaxID=2498619 RepID=A0A371CLS1_9APHY|nr:hypothetical protein OH76DRAFT_247974 [Polyporus brumalis]
MNDPASPPCAQVCSACRLESLSSAVSTHSTVVVSSCPVCWEMCRPFPARRISHDFITSNRRHLARTHAPAAVLPAGRRRIQLQLRMKSCPTRRSSPSGHVGEASLTSTLSRTCSRHDEHTSVSPSPRQPAHARVLRVANGLDTGRGRAARANSLGARPTQRTRPPFAKKYLMRLRRPSSVRTLSRPITTRLGVGVASTLQLPGSRRSRRRHLSPTRTQSGKHQVYWG